MLNTMLLFILLCSDYYEPIVATVLTLSCGQTAVNRGQFAVPPLRRDDYLAVSIINMIGIYLNTQLRTIYININIVEIDKEKDM